MPPARVVWARVAASDLEEIASYLAIDSPSAAEKFLDRLEEKAGTLETYPERGRLVPELVRFHIRSYREIIVAPYRLVYRIEGKVVNVIAVFDGRRDLSEVLLERPLRKPSP